VLTPFISIQTYAVRSASGKTSEDKNTSDSSLSEQKKRDGFSITECQICGVKFAGK
jgi:ribosomal protein L37AE/L43A